MRREFVVVLTVLALAALIAMAVAQPPGGGRGNQGPRGGMPRGMVMGTVVGATDEQVTVNLFRGDEQRVVALTDESVIVRAEAGARENLEDGAWVSISGRFNDEGVLEVSRVQVGDGVPVLGATGMGFGRGSTAMGRLSQVAGNQVSLALTIKLPELTEGTPISVRGTLDEDGTLVPTRVELGEDLEDVASPFGGMAGNAIASFGTISGIAEGAMTLSLTATLEADAQIAVLTVGEPADIMPGGRIFARGEAADDGVVTARSVLVGEFQALFGGRGGDGGGRPGAEGAGGRRGGEGGGGRRGG